MKRIDLAKYYIIIDNEIRNYDKYFNQVNSLDKVFVITDDNVYNLYHKDFEQKTNRKVFWHKITPGDSSKNIFSLTDILMFLKNNNFKKDDLLISFGGGMINDITGLAASIYLRGVKLIHIPTTLLSQIDSSVGGKTGINLDETKNLVGTFYNPYLVIIETNYLKTLPNQEIISGLGELIKTGFVGSENILKSIKKNKECYLDVNVVYDAIMVKKSYVEKDYYDQGVRHVLNFGHTIGHAVEAASNFKIPHGEAIMIGMLKAFIIGYKLKLTDLLLLNYFKEVLKAIDYEVTKINFSNYKNHLKYDKKGNGEGIKFVVIKEIGQPEIIYLTWDELYELANF